MSWMALSVIVGQLQSNEQKGCICNFNLCTFYWFLQNSRFFSNNIAKKGGKIQIQSILEKLLPCITRLDTLMTFTGTKSSFSLTSTSSPIDTWFAYLQNYPFSYVWKVSLIMDLFSFVCTDLLSKHIDCIG